MRIRLSSPDVGDLEIEYVTRVLRSGQLSLGPLVRRFEERFAAYVGSRDAVAVSSGTAALHLSVKALGIGPGDEVLTTAFSFAASVNCLLYEGATPVFADIDPETLNISPGEIRRTIERDYLWDAARRRLTNPRSGRVLKAILPVHVFGLPCEMEAICAVAREFSLLIVEDACEALGAKYEGRAAGTFGAAGAFGFYPNKQITTAEGGMIVTDDPRLAALCRSLRNQGRDEDGQSLRHIHLGYNYRLSDLHCALGVAQLERIGELLSPRARIAALYSRELSGIAEIALPSSRGVDGPSSARSWFVYVIRTRGPLASELRGALMNGLRRRGIACQAYFPAIHRQPYFAAFAAQFQVALPVTDSVSDSCLALPFSSVTTEAQVREVCGAIREIVSDGRRSMREVRACAAPM